VAVRRVRRGVGEVRDEPLTVLVDELLGEEVIKFHETSPHPTVLISPSMMEGVDLADDMSRFQILCKVPFPYLGDAAIKKRMIPLLACLRKKLPKLLPDREFFCHESAIQIPTNPKKLN